MGKVLVPAKIENVIDLYNAESGLIGSGEVRSIAVAEALVDTGASTLSMPKRLIDQLGLRPLRRRRTRTATGESETQMFGTVRLTVQGRDCTVDVSEIADGCPVLIGRIALELLDFVIDPAGRRLIGNPAHGGEHIIEIY